MMIYQFQIISWVLLGTAFMSLIVALIAWQRRSSLVAKYLTVLECGVFVWAFSSFFETAATSLSHILIWAQISYLGIVIVPLFFFLLALAYGRYYKYLAPRNLILLSIVPVFTILIVGTTHWHHMYYTSISIDPNTNLPIYGYSIWFWLYTIYSYALLGVGVIVLIGTSLRVPSFYKAQIIILIIGAILPFSGNLIYVFKINPIPGADWTPIAFGLSGIFLALGIFRFQLLPLAPYQLIERMDIGIMTTDSLGTILEFNPSMQEITGVPEKNAVGQKVIQVLAKWDEFINCYNVKTETKENIGLTRDKVTNYYDLQIVLLYDRHQRTAGQIIMLHDITEQKQSEERYRSLFDNVQNGFALHKIVLNKHNVPIDYTFVEINNAFLEQTGLEREKIIGKKVTKILMGIEKEPADWIGVYGKVALTGKKIKFEQYSNSLKRWYSVTAYSPKRNYFATLINDITEQKQADQLQAVIYQISEAVHSTKDLDMLYKSIHKILGQVLDVTNFYIAQYDDETKLLSFPFDVDSEDEFPTSARPLGNGITEYMIKTGKPLLLNKNDIEKYKQQGKFEAVGALSEQWMGSPLRIKNKVMGVIAVNSYHDPNLYTKSDLKILTFVAEQVAIAIEQKQSITDLEVEKTYLNELFTSSPEALALVTIDGTVLHINEQFATLFGFKEEDIFGRNIDDLLVPDSHKKIADDYTKKVAVGKRVYFEAVRKKKDGSSINVSVLSSPVNYKGDVLAVYAAYRDITDRIRATEIIKKSEEKYRTQSIELSESNSMKEMLLDVIAHDLRNPAGVIKGFAEFGLEMDPKNEILKEIEGGVDNLLNVIGDATTLSKVALGDKIKKEELDLVRIIKIAVDENASQIKLNEMALRMEMDESLKVHANPIICEVFRNYITNAIKYAKAGKKIIIDTVVDGEFVTVNVKDFGETIKLEDRENIFMRNVQLGKTKGRGLGLAIVKRIADAHEGEVGVMPNVPKGNIFYIKLPI